ncbi:MAG: hypothetical protein WKF33_00425 [Thermoleophilaceae bacterium]
MAGPPPDRFWKALLEERVRSRWGNFSWLSLYTVLASGNDALAKLDGGRIIDTRRMRWVAAQRAAGVTPYEPITLADAKSILLLGDPGEMDPSQYVLLRDLAATRAEALILMSDLVYPAGDINAWYEAVYLPYLGLPKSSWKAAETATTPVTLPNWPVFATPGNHDWYDGLSGFMYHACGAEPLPPVRYSSSGLGLVQRLTRAAWQHPARPDRAMLEPLRAEAANRWAGREKPGAIPHQPGPYFTIDIGRVRADTDEERAALRLVTVDTGVDGSLDVEQARWVRKMLEGRVPKIVITGKPLVVGNDVRDMPINRSSAARGEDDLPAGLRGLLAEETADRVIATVAGDIHNAQRVVTTGAVTAAADQPQGRKSVTLSLGSEEYEQARERALPPVQIVAGGGGAYLSETHTTRFCDDDALPLDGNEPVPAVAHHRFPSREVSARHFTMSVGRNAAGVLLGAAALLAASVLLTLWRGGAVVGRYVDKSELSVWHVVLASLAFLFFVGLTAGTISLLWRRWWWAGAGTAFLASISFVATLLMWDVSLHEAKLLAIGTGMAVAIPVLPLSIPGVQAFPLLGRLVPLRLLLATGLGTVGAALAQLSSSDHFMLALIVALVVAAVGLAFFRVAVARFVKWNDEATLHRTNKIGRFLYAVGTLWPTLLVLVPLVALWRSGPNGLFDVGLLMVLLELSITSIALAAFLSAPLIRACPFCPRFVLVAIGLASVASGVAAVLFADDLGPFASPPERLAAGLVIAVAVGFACNAVLLLTSTQPAATDAVTEALKKRDGQPHESIRSRDLFRTMVIAGTPGVSEIAEASRPPFHKSFLMLDVDFDKTDTRAVRFELYGLDDERAGTSMAHPARVLLPEKDQVNARGSFLVDSLTVKVAQPQQKANPA